MVMVEIASSKTGRPSSVLKKTGSPGDIVTMEPLLALIASMIWCALPSGMADESPTAPIKISVN